MGDVLSTDPHLMTLAPDQTELFARARADLRMGLPVTLSATGQSYLLAAAETLSEPRLEAIRQLDPNLSLVITARRADTLRARIYDSDLARLVVPAAAKLQWIQSVADPVMDLQSPLRGPFETARGGDTRPHLAALELAKSARLLPAMIVAKISETIDGVTQISLGENAIIPVAQPKLHRVSVARVPLSHAPSARLHIFRPDDGSDEHYVIEIGQTDPQAPALTRLHSACFTGDLLGSLKCDCGPQLQAAIKAMGAEGAGLVLYLNQEGRGIGLANKIRAYALQDQGFDTVDANHRLGFEDDERDFRIGAELLRKMGVSSVRLMTNNPAKLEMLQAQGIDVTERVPLKVGLTAENEAYLATKARRSGHIL